MTAASALQALIWDVDGTLAETERDAHLVAFNQALQAVGATWQWDEACYARLLRVAGGFERVLHDLQDRPQAPTDDAARVRLARAVHQEKNLRYPAILAASGIRLRPGVHRLIEACALGDIRLAIATTSSRSNVEALLHSAFGAGGPARFAALVCAEDAPLRKPDPQAFVLALDRLGLNAAQALVIEDSPNGLKAAIGAGLGTLITRSMYFMEEPFEGCAALCDDLDHRIRWPGGEAPQVDVAVLRRLHAHWNAHR